MEGFKVLSVTSDGKLCVFKIEDTLGKGPPSFSAMVNRSVPFLAMLKEAGHDSVFELFTLQGKKLTEARIISRGEGH